MLFFFFFKFWFFGLLEGEGGGSGGLEGKRHKVAQNEKYKFYGGAGEGGGGVTGCKRAKNDP